MKEDYKMSDKKVWDYRVVRQTTEEGDEWLSVQEVYYDDDEKPTAQTTDLQVEGDNIADLRKQLQSMIWALEKDVVDEIQNDVMGDNIEDRILSLEMENAEMRDRLDELGELLPAQGESEDIQNTIKEEVNKLKGL